MTDVSSNIVQSNNQEPTPAVEEKVDIDFSGLLAAEREAKGFSIKLGDETYETMPHLPADVIKSLAAVQREMDMGEYISSIGGLFALDDRERFEKFVKDSGMSVNTLTQIYKSILEKITGKNMTQQ